MTNLNRRVVKTMNSFVKLLKIIILSESCSKNCVGKIVQQFTSEGSMHFSESYSTNSPQRIVQRIYIGGLPTIKTNIFVEDDFHTCHKHV